MQAAGAGEKLGLDFVPDQGAPVNSPTPSIPDGDLERPKPRRAAMTVHEMRRVVTARHKVLATDKPTAEAIELLQDEYGADESSAIAFLEWLRGGPLEEPPSRGAVERVHVVADPETGEERYVDTVPGTIPPQPR